jgi:exopolysaccharide production protein ExoQ
MPPVIALGIWFFVLLALLIWDPAKEPKASLGLWVPLIWIFILSSRLPMQWLGGAGSSGDAQALQEGNPLDRSIFTILILLAVGVLFSRSFNWGRFLAQNLALVMFVLFALVSVLWSDYPFISFKRWYRDLGNYLVVLVVLSDTRPFVAVRTLFRRLAYFLIPLSILLIKYYPYIGKQYSAWTGANSYVGATTSKNMLGAVCLVSGMFFIWDTLLRWSNRKERQTKRILWVNCAFIVMILWLLNLANSATSRTCLVIGVSVIISARSNWCKRHPTLFKSMIPVIFACYVIIAFGFDLNGDLAGAVGRDPTLTDRTAIWKAVLSLRSNPIVGVGYESFWLPPRVLSIWKTFGPINESHNGYLEIYLNSGLIGVCLLSVFLIMAYRNICREPFTGSTLGALNLGFWTITMFYNMSEAAYKSHLIWAVILIAGMRLTARSPVTVKGLQRVKLRDEWIIQTTARHVRS